MSLRVHIAGLLFAVASVPASAAPIAYAESLGSGTGGSQGALYRIDLATRTASLIGLTGSVGGNAYPLNVRGLTFAPNNQLYAIAEDLGALVQINASTGRATLVGALGPSIATTWDYSLAFTCDGKAWLASGTTGDFWQVNPNTGAAIQIGNLGGTITGLATQGNTLYGSGSQSNQNLYTIDTANAKTTLIGAYGGTTGAVHDISPGFDTSGQLWAILNNARSSNEDWSNLAQVVSTSGAMTKLGTITGPAALDKAGLLGLAITPPTCGGPGTGGGDPATFREAPALPRTGMLLLAFVMIGLAGVGIRMRRRL